MIGAIGLEVNKEDHNAELGYWLGREFWNQGYCTEAAKSVIEFGFETVGLRRIASEHMARNPASGKVMQKAGLTREGLRRKHVRKWGVFEDVVVYGILSDPHKGDIVLYVFLGRPRGRMVDSSPNFLAACFCHRSVPNGQISTMSPYSRPRRIVGWAMSRKIDAQLAINALDQAIALREPAKDLIVHSDRGWQFASRAFRKRLDDCNFLQSISRKGNSYDNAPMESFFKSFKVEEVYHEKYESHEQAVRAANDYIERFYNPKRLHSALSYVSPNEFEQRLLLK